MKTILCFIFLLSLILFNANAGFDRGNGGDVLVCENYQHEIHMEFLDSYEMKLLDLEFNLGGDMLSVEEKIVFLLDRLKQHFPEWHKMLYDDFLGFHSNAKFLSNMALIDIPDSQHIVLPNGCSIRQAVVQKEPISFLHKRYTVDKDVWDKLDTNNKVMLIIHEVLYKHAIKWDHRDSIAVRLLSALLASGKIFELTLDQLVQVIYQNHLYFPISIDDFLFSKILETWGEGKVKRATLVNDLDYQTDRISLHLTSDEEIQFHKNGNLSSVKIERQDIRIDQNIFTASASVLSFHESGIPVSIEIEDRSSANSYTWGTNRFLAKNSIINFWETGYPKQLTLSEKQQIRVNENDRFKIHGDIEFDRFGNITKFAPGETVEIISGDFTFEVHNMGPYHLNYVEYFPGNEHQLKFITQVSSVTSTYQGHQLSFKGEIAFFENGKIEKLFLKKGSLININGVYYPAIDSSSYLPAGFSNIEFYPNGEIKYVLVKSNNQFANIEIQDHVFKFSPEEYDHHGRFSLNDYTFFFPNGKLKSGMVLSEEPMILNCTHNKKISIDANKRVRLFLTEDDLVDSFEMTACK